MEHINKWLILIIIALVATVLMSIISYRHDRTRYKYDLPEEIIAADSTDTMNAILIGDTIHITFRTKPK